MTCACGLGESNEVCCLPIIRGEAPAKTAEALMRSRYTAYVVGEIDYILNSVHPESPGDADRASTEAWSKAAEWVGLEIIETAQGTEQDEQGIVEFAAHFKLRNIPQKHHERALFKKHKGKWMYFDGEEKRPEPVRVQKVGRNEPCPCGSGKKYKKCCGAAA